MKFDLLQKVDLVYRISSGGDAGTKTIPCFVHSHHNKVKNFKFDITLMLQPGVEPGRLMEMTAPMYVLQTKKDGEDADKFAERKRERREKILTCQKSVNLVIRHDSSGTEAILSALRAMNDPKFLKKWSPQVVLNQIPSTAPRINLYGSDTSPEHLAKVEKAHAKLLTAVPWNQSQLEGLDVSHTPGGFHVVGGGPGAGKTTMQRSQTVAFVESDMRVLVTCPTNDGADRLAKAYRKAGIVAVRYYPASRELKPRNLWIELEVPEYFSEDGQVVNLDEF
jgi:hypothetical protein